MKHSIIAFLIWISSILGLVYCLFMPLPPGALTIIPTTLTFFGSIGLYSIAYLLLVVEW